MSAKRRLSAIDRCLRTLPLASTAASVFFRKTLLRLRDASRLEAGLVDQTALHRENSPFADRDFRTARVVFRRRAILKNLV